MIAAIQQFSIVHVMSLALVASFCLFQLPSAFSEKSQFPEKLLDLPEEWSYKLYNSQDVLQNMDSPYESNAEVGDFPPHLQYTFGFDQTGIVHPQEKVGMTSGGDPEFAGVLTSGTWTKKTKKRFFSNPADEYLQKFNRCGSGWSLFADNMAYQFSKKRWVDKTGNSFLDMISKNGYDTCELHFEWNQDLTSAKITNYFESTPTPMGKSFMSLSIELAPYWRWKFGFEISKKEEKEAKLMDGKCCPSDSCRGKATLGEDGPCETISMACGEILDDDVNQCPFFVRKNKIAGIKKIANYYYVYPLGDKYGNPTPYFKHFIEAYVDNNVKHIFHVVKRNSDIDIPIGNEEM
eukprot:CAMPEP_0194108906 /NCGR_PEP_ID=MMETSP0150-20130528/8532_1 /TAXON_ID=122233 /ORGANISM="Chaetoceros debilis, Strain MM31A-1" /LENGTH=348 /DNA_ID=CAMNT_0038797731 /DNA_START=14 /DNA_END=1060 /DNA_ORIENTATION=-